MPEPLKNIYNPQSVAALAAAVKDQFTAFDEEAFLTGVFDAGWNSLTLKQRMRRITTVLRAGLPRDYHAALDVLFRVLPLLGELGFEKMIFPDFVEVYGLDDWEASIAALEEFTQHISAEFAIRPFITRYQDSTMAQMLQWARHEKAEVRRLASEGSRPRLPWGVALPGLKADPSPILPILELLKSDASESVRRSVANNLNDISKDNPDVVIELLGRWQQDGSDEIQSIIRHALRTLLKQGHPDALELLGYSSEPTIAVHNLAVAPRIVPMGDIVTFSFEIESHGLESQELMVDYVVYLMRANGKQTPKVFKLGAKTLRPGKVVQIQRKHSFAPVTTRKYYPGAHAIEPKINGKLFGRVEFTLSED
jgi:3-methyladenine DNA glycosylase AlkC